jgi:metal-responsive CopG/Arc/MetJ family transcriptional regulator
MTITEIGVGMRTIQMTLDEDIVESVDKIVRELGTTRSHLRERLCGQR